MRNTEDEETTASSFHPLHSSPSHGGFAIPTEGSSTEPEGAFPSRQSMKKQDVPHERSRPFSWLLELLIIFAGAAVIAVLLRMFVVQVYQIPSESMNNTLQSGSRIAVNRIPVLGKEVERGDVVVFEDTEGWMEQVPAGGSNPIRAIGEFLGLVPPDGEQVLVKRIIGTGGDTVSCCDVDGRLQVNGVSIDEPYLLEPETRSTPEFSVVVPEGRLWVMGDNRSNSADSVYHYFKGDEATIDESAVIGRAWAEIWPVSEWSSLGNRNVFAAVPEP